MSRLLPARISRNSPMPRAGIPRRARPAEEFLSMTTSQAFFVLSALAVCGPAFGQVDFTGEWAPAYHEDGPERIPGPEIGDYLGIPLNDAARLRADSYDADRISVVSEYQCRPHSADYSMRGLANMRVDLIRDPITQRFVAFHTRINF